jgi:hypothetical protein
VLLLLLLLLLSPLTSLTSLLEAALAGALPVCAGHRARQRA